MRPASSDRCFGSLAMANFLSLGTPSIFAIAILVSPYARKRWTDVAVLGLVFVAALGLGPITVPALAIPIYVFLAKPDTMSPGRRKAFIVVSVLLIAAILIITKWLMMTHQTRVLQFAFKGIIDGLLLIFFSAGRFLVAWTPFVEFEICRSTSPSQRSAGRSSLRPSVGFRNRCGNYLAATLGREWTAGAAYRNGAMEDRHVFSIFSPPTVTTIRFSLAAGASDRGRLTHLTHRMSQAASPERERGLSTSPWDVSSWLR